MSVVIVSSSSFRVWLFKEMQYQEKKAEKNEYFQTQWRKHVDKITIPPKQTPVYLAVSKGEKGSKEKKHRTGEEPPA